MAPSRVRSYCFTLNNPGPETEALLESIAGYTYLTFGREVAPTTGTRHLQGFIRFRDGKSKSSVRRLIPGAHIEKALTITAAIQYCQKDGDFVEFGTKPLDDAARGELELERWKCTWELAKTGCIEEIPFDIRIRYYNAIRRIEKDFMVKPRDLPAVCGTWVHGSSGVGKSHSVRSLFPDLYSKNASKWWDGYQAEDTVLFDDLGTTEAGWVSRFVKIWADRYPFIADVKGGSICIRPRRFIVTSQFTIRQLFSEQTTVDALERRFTVIERFSQEEILVIE